MPEKQKEAQPVKQSETSTYFKKYGLFVLLLLILFGIIFGFSFLSKKSWQNGLKEQIQTVLANSTKEKFTLGDYVYLNSPFDTSCAMYTYKNANGSKKGYALILRMQTIYGPQPAVFLYTSGKEAQFVDFVSFGGKAKQQIQAVSKDAQIAYWCKRIPEIIQAGNTTGVKGEKQ